MLKLGLTSVTFRNLGYMEIIEACKKCGLEYIEWGSDVHVPVNDKTNAKRVKEACDDANIKIPSYGSYYKCGEYDDAVKEFEKYINVAQIIGATVIRIWIGTKDFETATEEYKDRIVSELIKLCDIAAGAGIVVASELHGGTLCNNRKNSLEIVKRVNMNNFGLYFQYDWKYSLTENCDTLKDFIPVLHNVHVFNIIEKEGKRERISLGDGEGEMLWKHFAEILKSREDDTTLMFEFLPEVSCKCLKQEVDILKSIVQADE